MKRYLTRSPAPRTYIQRAKGTVQHILSQRGISHVTLSACTGIPRTTLQRWLSTSNDGFMTVGDAVVICEYLGISIHSMLPEPSWTVCNDQSRAALLREVEKIPEEHLRALLSCYAVIAGSKVG